MLLGLDQLGQIRYMNWIRYVMIVMLDQLRLVELSGGVPVQVVLGLVELWLSLAMMFNVLNSGDVTQYYVVGLLGQVSYVMLVRLG